MRRWIRERTDELQLLDHRSRPAVRDDDGQRVLVTGSDMDEVDVYSIDGGDELWQRVQLRLRLAPVVAAAPVLNEFLQLGERHALRLVGNGLLVGPARGGDASAKVVERGLAYL